MNARIALLALLAVQAGAPDPAAAQRDGRTAGWIGVSVDVTETREGGARVSGSIMVADVVSGGPAATSGIRPGDRLVRIGGQPASLESLARLTSRMASGDRLTLTLERDGWRRDVTLTAAPRPDEGLVTLPRDVAGRLQVALRRLDSLRTGVARVQVEPRELARLVPTDSGVVVFSRGHSFAPASGTGHPAPPAILPPFSRRDTASAALLRGMENVQELVATAEAAALPGRWGVVPGGEALSGLHALAPYLAGRNRLAGAEMIPLNRELGAYFSGLERGMLVTEVLEGTPAADAGLRPGDVVVEADGRPVDSLDALRASLYATHREADLVLTVVRRGSRTQVRLPR